MSSPIIVLSKPSKPPASPSKIPTNSNLPTDLLKSPSPAQQQSIRDGNTDPPTKDSTKDNSSFNDQTFPNQKDHNPSRYPSTHRVSSGERVTYYFENFPDDWNAKALFNMFSKFSEVDDVYIPTKRNIRGRRFGFLRFKKPIDREYFEKCMLDFWIGGTRIKVNPARFGKKASVDRHELTRQTVPTHRKPRLLPNRKRDSRSFSEFVRGSIPAYGPEVRGTSFVKKSSFANLEFRTEEEELLWLRDSAVGYLRSAKDITNIQEKFLEANILNCRVRPMGGTTILLSFDCRTALQKCMTEHQVWLKELFSSISQWDSDRVTVDRLVWLRIQGIPLQAWSQRFFNTIGNMHGRFISTDKATEDKTNLEAARILIACSSRDFINQVQNVKIDGEHFELSIMEEPCLGSFACWANCQLGENLVVEREETDLENEFQRLSSINESSLGRATKVSTNPSIKDVLMQVTTNTIQSASESRSRRTTAHSHTLETILAKHANNNRIIHADASPKSRAIRGSTESTKNVSAHTFSDMAADVSSLSKDKKTETSLGIQRMNGARTQKNIGAVHDDNVGTIPNNGDEVLGRETTHNAGEYSLGREATCPHQETTYLPPFVPHSSKTCATHAALHAILQTDSMSILSKSKPVPHFQASRRHLTSKLVPHTILKPYPISHADN